MPITDQAQADEVVNNAHKHTPRNAKTQDAELKYKKQ